MNPKRSKEFNDLCNDIVSTADKTYPLPFERLKIWVDNYVKEERNNKEDRYYGIFVKGTGIEGLCRDYRVEIFSSEVAAQKSINTINAKIKDRDCFEIKELEIKLKENE
jgi:hypothetical protein